MIRVKALGSQNGSAWNELVEQSLNASLTHLWEWGEVLSSTYGYQRYYLVAEQNEDFAGSFPLIHVKSVIFGNRLISLPSCEYAGPLVRRTLDSSTARQVIGKLLVAGDRLARSLRAEYLEIRGSSDEVTSDVLQRSGYTRFQRYVTFRVDLAKPVEALWRGLSKKTRNATRKAIEKGVQVTQVKKLRQLETYYSLYLRTQKRLGSPPHSYAFFKNLFETFCPEGRMQMMLAEHQGKPISGIMTYHWDNRIYWVSNVTDMEHRHLNPTNLLLWKTIECGSKNHNEALDLGRTRPNTTIHHFKKTWGGKEAQLHDYVHFFGKARIPPDPTQRKYVLLSKFWSLVPIATSSRLGPRIISGIAL